MAFMMNEISEVIRNVNRQKDEYLKKALNELVSRDLIVIEQTEPVLIEVKLPGGGTEIRLEQAIRLVPKEFEYIKKLEATNARLRDAIKMAVEAYDLMNKKEGGLNGDKETKFRENQSGRRGYDFP